MIKSEVQILSLSVSKLEDGMQRLQAFLDMGHLSKFVSEEFNTNIPRYFPSLNTQIDTIKTIQENALQD